LPRRGKLTYTKEEAEHRLPFILKRITLTAIDCMEKLDKHPMTSYEVESLIYTIEGLSAFMMKLYHHVQKEQVKAKILE